MMIMGVMIVTMPVRSVVEKERMCFVKGSPFDGQGLVIR